MASLLVDVGVGAGERVGLGADISAETVATGAGVELWELQTTAGRGIAIETMARGAVAVVSDLYGSGRLDAIVAIGGSGGTTIATAAMRALPFGVPKLMVSTLASGDVSEYMQGMDMTMAYPVVDPRGRELHRRASAAISRRRCRRDGFGRNHSADTLRTAGRGCNHVRGHHSVRDHGTRRTRATRLRGTHVPCYRRRGNSMERLVASEMIDAVLDATTTELADELVGGIHPAGPERLRTAARLGIPQVVSVGALDMVNFGPPETVPRRLAGRPLVRHNPHVTLVRTTPEECAELGRRLAERVRDSTGPVSVYLPLRGVSMLSIAGKPFHDPEADEALFDAIRVGCGHDGELVELDCDINDPVFARSMATKVAAWAGVAR